MLSFNGASWVIYSRLWVIILYTVNSYKRRRHHLNISISFSLIFVKMIKKRMGVA